MSYRYRCRQCRTSSRLVTTRAEAAAEGRRHRIARHGGHIPDGERLLHYGPSSNEWWHWGNRHLLWAVGGVIAFIGWLKGYRL